MKKILPITITLLCGLFIYFNLIKIKSPIKEKLQTKANNIEAIKRAQPIKTTKKQTETKKKLKQTDPFKDTKDNIHKKTSKKKIIYEDLYYKYFNNKKTLGKMFKITLFDKVEVNAKKTNSDKVTNDFYSWTGYTKDSLFKAQPHSKYSNVTIVYNNKEKIMHFSATVEGYYYDISPQQTPNKDNNYLLKRIPIEELNSKDNKDYLPRPY
jgi:hypothetical protein